MKFPAFEPIDLSNSAQSFEAVDLYISRIEPDSNQPRKLFSEDTLEELAISIKNHGVIQPIIVRTVDNGRKYQIIAGERRWRAAKMVGLEKIPAIIKEYDNVQRMAVSLIENIQRENLNPLEEAQAIQSLLNECDMTHNEVAESIGRSRTTVTNILRLLALTREVKVMVSSGFLEMGHARALLCLSNTQQVEAAELVILKNLSVRETEKLVQRITMGQSKKEIGIHQEYQTKAAEWNTLLSRKFSSNVNVNLKPDGKGKLVFQFESIEEAEWLIDNLIGRDFHKKR
ncbi:MAG: ParB/RepB/Spo0J family partition protein [Gammaproteobacteria bacterium]|nr:ParB/RepB/Spo0J family partition protein [Gammaproteobacteria bacterium]